MQIGPTAPSTHSTPFFLGLYLQLLCLLGRKVGEGGIAARQLFQIKGPTRGWALGHLVEQMQDHHLAVAPRRAGGRVKTSSQAEGLMESRGRTWCDERCKCLARA